MPAAVSTVPCVVCRRELDAPPHGGTVACPQCGEVNRVAAGRTADGDRSAAVTCPACGEPVAADAPACPTCGELLGPLATNVELGGGATAEGRASGATLGGVFMAALRDYAAHWWLLPGSVLGAMLLWIMLFVSQVLLGIGAIFVSEPILGRWGDLEPLGFFFGYGLGALAALPINAAVPLGLANLHLAVARGTLPRGGRGGEGVKFAPLWQTRGKRRMLLCGGLVLGVLAGQWVAFAWVSNSFWFDLWAVLPGDSMLTILIGGYALPAILFWTLFWPLPYVIVDRPDLRHLRPLKACLTLPAGRWGGHLAIGAITAALLILGTLPWGVALPITGPLAGLLTAHAYDRAALAAIDGEETEPLDPEGLL